MIFCFTLISVKLSTVHHLKTKSNSSVVRAKYVAAATASVHLNSKSPVSAAPAILKALPDVSRHQCTWMETVSLVNTHGRWPS